MSPMDPELRSTWTRRILVAEALILGWSAVGPVYRHVSGPDPGPGAVARYVLDDPTLLQAVVVNAAGLHLVLGSAALAVWILGRSRSG